jgi:hypothetical protein
VEHSATEAVEVGVVVVAPCDQLAVELHVGGQLGELRHQRRHVPAAAAPDAEPAAVYADQAAKPV